ncbi:MAG TPA: polysaccharide lyase family 1 protein, partial [Burkholderiaceae bacterium]
WAAADGGTRGGADAKPEQVFDVRNRDELVAALNLGSTPKIIRLHGRIDLQREASEFADPVWNFAAFQKAYDPATWGQKAPEGEQEEARRRSAKRQAAWTVLRVPSNTTLIGVGSEAGLAGATLFLDKVDNVIIRKLHLSDAYDHFPAWDPKDNGHGEWNSEYDTVTLRGATHVWIDHCTFDDGAHPDQAEASAFGQQIQHHDGLLDVTQQSDLVTISWNVFSSHEKTSLVGSSDAQRLDDGKLRVSYHHNLFENVKERTPRVRWGAVHVFNNLFVGRSDASYGYGYSLGVGAHSRIVSENNAWELSPDIPAARIVKWWKGQLFSDRGSLLNGQAVDLLASLRAANPGVEISAEVGWQPTLFTRIDPANEVAALVRAGAGAGR